MSPQRCVPQDTGFSSLLLKVLLQTLQWLDSPGAEAGPLRAQLKLSATQYSARRRISDGEGGGEGRQPAPAGGGSPVGTQGSVCSGLRASGLWGGASHGPVPAVRSGFLHLAEALAFRGDAEVVSSTARALVAALRSGEKCGVEPELVDKGMGPRPGSTGLCARGKPTPGSDRLATRSPFTPGRVPKPHTLLVSLGVGPRGAVGPGAGLSRSPAV